MLPFRPRVLLAEDSPTSQLILARQLHVIGADETIVDDGEEALAAVEATEFDIILMDIEMPVMDGLEAAVKMRENKVRLPIVAVTGHEEKSLAGDGFDRNFDGFPQKPTTKAQLIEMLTYHYGRERRRGLRRGMPRFPPGKR